MEGMLVLGCAAASGAAALALTSGGRSLHEGRRELRRLRAWQRVRRLLAALSRTSALSRLLGMDAWGGLASAVAEWADARGVGLSREEAGSAMALSCLSIGLAGGLAARSAAGFVVVEGLCALGVQVIRSSRERRRAQELSESMPGVFRTLAVALGSGQTLSQAIDYVGAHERGPAAKEFARTSLRLRCGVGAEEALAQLMEELDAPGIGLLVTALLISQRTGSPLRDLFQRSARLVERQGEFERTLSVKTAQVRLSVRIVCLLPVLMIALLSLISPDFQVGLTSPVGSLSVVLALGMDGVALLIIRRLLKGVL